MTRGLNFYHFLSLLVVLSTPGHASFCAAKGVRRGGLLLYCGAAVVARMDPASNAESAQNVEMFKIKKLIKGLEAARGYAEGERA